jgi:hypothetical protein
VVITVDVASIIGDSGHGHSGVNAGDIVPPFPYGGQQYGGINWDPTHPVDGCGIYPPPANYGSDGGGNFGA